MKKRLSLILLLFFLAVAYLYLHNTQPTVCIKEVDAWFSKTCLSVELASDQKSRSDGLMGRTSLDSGSGMIFLFPKPDRYSFWMKNTLIPLDIIWVSGEHQIVKIKTVPPCKVDKCPSYRPDLPSLYVIEANSGLMDELGIKVGDRVSFHGFETVVAE